MNKNPTFLKNKRNDKVEYSIAQLPEKSYNVTFDIGNKNSKFLTLFNDSLLLLLFHYRARVTFASISTFFVLCLLIFYMYFVV